MPKELLASFYEAANHLIKWLNDHPDQLDPHHVVIVTPNSAELLSGVAAHRTSEFVKD